MIQPTPATIGEIFTSPTQFVVPKYQRGYTWEKGEASEFMDDLLGEAEAGRGLFLGTLIFDVSSEKDKKVTVVDGQQRLTTILLLLIACRRRATELEAHDIATVIQQKITFVDQSTAKSEGPRLVASESIKDVFEYIADSGWSGHIPTKIAKRPVKRQANRIRPVYEFLSNFIKDRNRDEVSKLLDAIYKTRVIRIEIHGEEEAFSLFERTNARGTDLEVSDLLKNYLYQQGVSDLDDKWKEIIENSEGTILKMLKYFYVAKRGYISKSELYRKIKDYCKATGGAAELVEQLREFSKFYGLIRKEGDKDSLKKYFESLEAKEITGHQHRYEQIHICLQGLRLFKVSQIYPVAFAAISCFIRNGGGTTAKDAKALVRLFEDIEKYHFINNAICDRVGNEVEKLYAGFCVKYQESDNFMDTTAELTKELRSRLAKEEEFSIRFCDLSYSPETISLVAYIFDRMSNYAINPGERIAIYSPGHQRANHNIEHFYPQKPESDLPPDPETLDVVDNIGNLLAISFSANASLGNASPAKKVKRLNGDLLRKVQNLHYVRDFLEKYEKQADSWGKTAIWQRARDLAHTAYTKVWKIN